MRRQSQPALGFAALAAAALMFLPAASAQAGLLAWWSFDNPDSASDTTFIDETGKNPEGSFNNGAGFTANGGGHSGDTGDYAGTDWGYGSVPDNDGEGDDLDVGDRNFTISFWARRTDNDRIDGVMGQRNRRPGYNLFFFNDENSLRLRLDDNEGDNVRIDSGSSFWSTSLDGNWHHYTWSIDKSSTTGGKMYFDGSLISSHDFTGIDNISNTNTDLRIGVFRSYKDEFFNGDLDDIAIFDRALNGNEVQSLADGVAPDMIPEPASLALLAPAGLLALRRRRR